MTDCENDVHDWYEVDESGAVATLERANLFVLISGYVLWCRRCGLQTVRAEVDADVALALGRPLVLVFQ